MEAHKRFHHGKVAVHGNEAIFILALFALMLRELGSGEGTIFGQWEQKREQKERVLVKFGPSNLYTVHKKSLRRISTSFFVPEISNLQMRSSLNFELLFWEQKRSLPNFDCVIYYLAQKTVIRGGAKVSQGGQNISKGGMCPLLSEPMELG